MHIAESLRLNALRHPDKTATVCGTRRLTYAELNRRANRLANAFAGLGYSPGDKVALLLHNGTEYVECFAGLTKVGLIPVPISYLLTDADVEAILENSDAVASVVDQKFLDRLIAMRCGLKHVVVVDGLEAASKIRPYEDLLAAARDSEPADRGKMTSAIMIHSSGTTGLPKGILRSRYGLPERAIQQGFRPDHTMLCVMPMFFSMGAACALLAIYLGETMVFASRFDPEENLRLIEQERVGAVPWVVTMLKDVVRVADGKRDAISSLNLILTSGQLSDEDKAAVFELFGPVVQSYFGSSETGPSNFMGPKDLLRKSEPNCVGKVFFGNEVVLLDDGDRQVAVGEIGRICCKGPGTYDCYYRDPEATARTMCGEYVSVGDMGRFDEEGYLYFEGRSQDMIKTGGMNVYAQEVEDELAKHPDIKEVCVIGVPDERWIEAVKAVVVLKEGSSLTQDGVIAFGKESLPSFKAPKSVAFVRELPRNLMGKVLKEELKRRFTKKKGHDSDRA
ncbi:MAG: AMP-binding protein [Hyphomicrobiales bacterium]|nr:AMP-binding protein [Hyphomicrobiales bacterium]